MVRTSMFVLVVLAAYPPPQVYAQHRLVIDPDSVLSLHVPDTWVDTDAGNPDASVQIASPGDDAFLMVIIEPKDDFFGWNMDRFLYVTIAQNVAATDFPEVSEIEHLEVDGSPAARLTISGATGGQQFVYRRLAVDGPMHWIQVILGVRRSSWPAHQSVFEEVLASVDLIATGEGG